MTYLEMYRSRYPHLTDSEIIHYNCPDGLNNTGNTCTRTCSCTECWNSNSSEEPAIKDSGDRTEFETGAVRDMREGKGRCDLMPLDVVADYMKDIPLRNIADFQQTGKADYLIYALNDFCLQVYDENDATMFLEVAKHFEDGAKKYGENNWQKGIPVKCYIDSAVRHYLKWNRKDEDEPHDRAFVWNILCAIWTCKNMPELNDYKKEEIPNT